MKKPVVQKCGFLLSCCIIFSSVGFAADADTKKIPLTTSSDKARALYHEGMSHYDQGRFPAAIEKFDRAIAADAGFGMAYLMSAAVWYYEGDLRKRDALMEKAEATTGLSEGETLLIQLEQAFIAGDREKQKQLLDKLVELHPDDATVQLFNGIYLRGSGKSDKSIEALKQAVAQSPTYEAYVQLGFSCNAAKKYEDALSNFNKAVELAPDTPAALAGMGYTLRKMGKFDESIQAFDRALKYDPSNMWALSGQGDVYLVTDKPEQARQSFQKMLAAAQDYRQQAWAHEQMAAYYWYQDQPDRACDEFEKKTDVYEKAGDMEWLGINYRLRGHIYRVLGKEDEAERMYGKWIELVKKSDKTEDSKNQQMAIYYYWMIEVALARPDIQQAKIFEQQFEKLNLKPEHFNNYYPMKAALAAAEGRYDDALSLSENQKNYLLQARVYRDKGDKAKAREVYQKLFDINDDALFWRILEKKQAADELAKL